MGHYALTDVSRERFYAFERFGRAAKGLAGARAEPFRVWLDDWGAEAGGEQNSGDVPLMHLFAGEAGVAIDLRVVNEKSPVLQGADGLSQKGERAGNASYYYSLTRMRAEGTVQLSGGEVPVKGTVWMDREWSTSALEEGQVGWDWFSLQLSDSTELMVYRLRREGGATDRMSKGSIVDARGAKTNLSSEDVGIETLGRWGSPRGGEYPSRWRLTAERVGLDLGITPLVADQELDVSFRYWEGAIRVSGTRAGRPVTGFGYVELTGYAD
jgi:predicted secreted hydrolase